jgi:hypothetical protein
MFCTQALHHGNKLVSGIDQRAIEIEENRVEHGRPLQMLRAI